MITLIAKKMAKLRTNILNYKKTSVTVDWAYKTLSLQRLSYNSKKAVQCLCTTKYTRLTTC